MSFTESPLAVNPDLSGNSICTHLAAKNALWGTVAQCKANDGYTCEIDDDHCTFLPHKLTVKGVETIWDKTKDYTLAATSPTPSLIKVAHNVATREECAQLCL